MESLVLEGTNKTPAISFSDATGLLELKGRSIPENAIEFYKPLIKWIDDYATSPKENTQVNVQLEYFNTSSSKCILDLLKKLEPIHSKGVKITINWHYEEDDEDMLEAGEDYQAIIKVPFQMVPIELD
jgi:hypothetical protein